MIISKEDKLIYKNKNYIMINISIKRVYLIANIYSFNFKVID